MASIIDAKMAAVEVFGGALSPWSLYRLARMGLIPCVRAGKRVLFARAELEKWAAAGGLQAAQNDQAPTGTTGQGPRDFGKIRPVNR